MLAALGTVGEWKNSMLIIMGCTPAQCFYECHVLILTFTGRSSLSESEKPSSPTGTISIYFNMQESSSITLQHRCHLKKSINSKQYIKLCNPIKKTNELKCLLHTSERS